MSSTPVAGTRRPGRPAQFDRDSALAALLGLLWIKGYDAATQEEMLAATGLSSSTLYRSFGTKADILEAALAQYLAYLDEMFSPLEHGCRGWRTCTRFSTTSKRSSRARCATPDVWCGTRCRIRSTATRAS